MTANSSIQRLTISPKCLVNFVVNHSSYRLSSCLRSVHCLVRRQSKNKRDAIACLLSPRMLDRSSAPHLHSPLPVPLLSFALSPVALTASHASERQREAAVNEQILLTNESERCCLQLQRVSRFPPSHAIPFHPVVSKSFHFCAHTSVCLFLFAHKFCDFCHISSLASR